MASTGEAANRSLACFSRPVRANASARVSMPLTPDEERMAEALAVERAHGERALAFVAERIEALTGAGDMAGVARWQAIAARLAQLRPSSTIQ